jgi:lysophospholipid acyltransferase 5
LGDVTSPIDDNLTIIGRVATLLGSEENALRIIYSLLLGYPLAMCHRQLLYGRSANVQHVFFTACGLWLCYFNFGLHVIHSVANIIMTYLILVFTAGTQLSIVLAFLANMLYLCIGYYITMTDSYTIKWTTPHCVLTLRLIGLVCDVYDGRIPSAKLSSEQKETALVPVPSLLEICGHSYFFGGFLVGPQFPMKRYQDFVSGSYQWTEWTSAQQCEAGFAAATSRWSVHSCLPGRLPLRPRLHVRLGRFPQPFVIC